MTFLADTTSTEVPGDVDRRVGHIQAGWDIAGNANGGYLLSIAARAMRDRSGRGDPVTVTAHYLRPGRPGPVEVLTEVVKSGKAFTVLRGTLVDSEGSALLSLLGTFGDLADSDSATGPELVTAGPPELPPFDSLIPTPSTEGFPPPFMGRVDLRIHPDDAGFRSGAGSGTAQVRGWFALPDDEPVDTIGLLLATDAFPPTIFNTDLPVAWVPTVELTVHVRARPAPGPLRCRFTTRFVTGGFLEEDGEVWDRSGRLVAQSRQLALLPRA